MKPFDLEAAKAGAKLVTRDGREAVFIAHDPLAEGDKVVARINGELRLYQVNGAMWSYLPSEDDLFMALTERTVYVNFHRNDSYAEWFNTKEKAEAMLVGNPFAVAVPVEIEE